MFPVGIMIHVDFFSFKQPVIISCVLLMLMALLFFFICLVGQGLSVQGDLPLLTPNVILINDFFGFKYFTSEPS